MDIWYATDKELTGARKCTFGMHAGQKQLKNDRLLYGGHWLFE